MKTNDEMRMGARSAFAATALALALGVSGCANKFIDVRPGSTQVALATAEQVARCVAKGQITVSVIAKLAFITRSDEAVEANLLQLARNGAVDAGADTVVKGNSTEYGTRSFAMYKCTP